MGTTPRRLCKSAAGLLITARGNEWTKQNRSVRCRPAMTKPPARLARLRTACMAEASFGGRVHIGLVIRAVPRSPVLASGKSQESVTPSVSLLPLTVGTPRTHAGGSSVALKSGIRRIKQAQRRPPCDKSRRLTCSESGGPYLRQSCISAAQVTHGRHCPSRRRLHTCSRTVQGAVPVSDGPNYAAP